MNTYRNLKAEYRALDTPGEFEAVVSAYGVVDSYGTRATEAFWRATLERRPNPKLVWAHDWTRPIGRTISTEHLKPGDERLPEMARAGGGLLIRGQLNLACTDGANAYALLKAGDIDEWSFGAIDVEFAKSEEDNVMDFALGDVREFSPVLVGSNPATGNVSVRNEGLRLADHFEQVVQNNEVLIRRVSDVQSERSYISANQIERLEILRSNIETLLNARTEARDTESGEDTKRPALKRQLAKTLIQNVQDSYSQERER